MSGIIGIINGDGKPVDKKLLDHMTQFLAYRGPDGQQVWIDGGAGLGHAMLRATKESSGERQPCSLDNQLWITADARIDGRADLIEKLRSKAESVGSEEPDAALILKAYRAWGDDCVNHLIGDFAFAIWDKQRQQLFCARDHLGVKPFYYAQKADCIIFGNTLDCLRLHPEIKDELNDQAIGDFLLLDYNLDPTTTTFAEIKRLPPAHCLTWSAGAVRLNRYWSLPTEGRIRYRKSSDYYDHFLELLSAAVGDRLRVDNAAMSMSGGVDSTAVATTAQKLLAKRGTTSTLRAYTFVYDRLMPDKERYYSALAAKALAMPIEHLPLDDYKLFERYDQDEVRKPEPYHWPLEGMTLDLYRHISRSHRVMLTGDGGDPLSYFGSLLNTPRFHKLVPDAVAYLFSRRRIPAIGLRTKLKLLMGKISLKPPYPAWLDQEFAKRLDLPARFDEICTEQEGIHPTHAKAYKILSRPYWQFMFERYDPGATRLPLEFRHPLFDIRLIDYVLAIPLIPWSVDKELLRSVGRGIQPDEVRLRRKSPLVGDPLLAHLQNGRTTLLDHFVPAKGLADYVNKDALPHPVRPRDSEQLWVDLRPLSFNHWLHQAQPNKYKSGER